MNNFATLPELLHRCAESYGDQAAVYQRRQGGWFPIPYSTLEKRVLFLAAGLTDLGIREGESLGLIAPSSPDWVTIDLAIQLAGGVTVPIFKRISEESLTHEIEDSGMRYIFVGNDEELGKVTSCGGKHLEHIITFGFDPREHHFYEALFQRGKSYIDQHPDYYERRLKAQKGDNLATIIYTSGSTGLPKGVMLSQANIVSQVHGSAERFPLRHTEDTALSTLPLAHIFERMVVYFYFSQGVNIYFVDDPKKVGDQIREVRPTVMTVVPRLLEKVYMKMREKAETGKGIKKRLALAAFARAESKDETEPFSGIKDLIYQGAVYKKLREALGGRLRLVISGAAAMPPAIGRFFMNIGMPLYEGYGMTEASPVIAANKPGANKLGTVGLPFPNVEVQVSEEGEILARGPNVMRGYHNRPDATAETLKEGWLHTGDLGSLDRDGYLTVSGRKKELFKKSTGEYVPPAPIEQALGRIAWVDSAVVIADGRTFASALLFPDPEALQREKKRLGFEKQSDDEFVRNPRFMDTVQEVVDGMNRHLHHCENVERFRIVAEPLTIDKGELTPTMKIRRHIVEEKYRDLIEEIYSDTGGWK